MPKKNYIQKVDVSGMGRRRMIRYEVNEWDGSRKKRGKMRSFFFFKWICRCCCCCCVRFCVSLYELKSPDSCFITPDSFIAFSNQEVVRIHWMCCEFLCCCYCCCCWATISTYGVWCHLCCLVKPILRILKISISVPTYHEPNQTGGNRKIMRMRPNRTL